LEGSFPALILDPSPYRFLQFEVEMEDNWYEAAVSATAPHRIISVVDWASDAAVPIPKPEETATYNVFKFGVNDPAEGERTTEKENFDTLASPVGWHSLPFANDPYLKGLRLMKTKEFYRNTTTTWGNNVYYFWRQFFPPFF
jgi:extracellular elastinolytic metalloproteinase